MPQDKWYVYDQKTRIISVLNITEKNYDTIADIQEKEHPFQMKVNDLYGTSTNDTSNTKEVTTLKSIKIKVESENYDRSQT